MSEIVPFGKYKDRNIAELAADREYCDWLAAQPWFRQRYGNLYQLVVVNAGSPSEDTPEHNKLQAMFLDKDFCKAAILTLAEYRIKQYRHDLEEYDIAEAKRLEKSRLPEIITFHQQPDHLFIDKVIPSFEDRSGFDVVIQAGNQKYYECVTVNIEVKPTIGDDYPSILRQIKAQATRFSRSCPSCLIYGSFIAEGINEQQMRDILVASGVLVCTIDEIKATLAQIRNP